MITPKKEGKREGGCFFETEIGRWEGWKRKKILFEQRWLEHSINFVAKLVHLYHFHQRKKIGILTKKKDVWIQIIRFRVASLLTRWNEEEGGTGGVRLSLSSSSAVCFKVSGEANKHWICSREGNRRMPPHPIHSIREREKERETPLMTMRWRRRMRRKEERN